jgi:tetratricopeptide (TPR) repeat protein
MWLPAVAALFLFQSGQAPADEGLKALEEQKYEAAAEAFSRAVAADPQDYSALFHLALAHSMLGKDAEAVAGYRKVLALKPGLYQAELNLGILLVNLKEAEGGVPLLKSAAAQAPGKFAPNFYLAEALYATADDSGAESYYRKAAELDPKAVDARIGLGRALANQGRYEEALAEYRQAAAADPKYREYLLELASRMEEKGQREKAITIYREFQGKPEVEERLGNLLLQAGNVEEAIPHLEVAARMSPTAANRFALASAYLKNKQPAEAAPLLELVLAEQPDSFEIRMTYGRLLRDQKKYPSAAQEFLRAAQLQPKSKDAWSELAGMLMLMEHHPQALAALDRVEALDPQNVGVHFFRAITLDKTKQYEAALASYDKFLAMSNGTRPDEEFKARQRVKVIKKELSRR